MIHDIKIPTLPANISETIAYLEEVSQNGQLRRRRRTKEIERLYCNFSESLHLNLTNLVKAWGDSLAIRQILFYIYLQMEPLIGEIFCKIIYPSIKENFFSWKSSELTLFFDKLGLTRSEQFRTKKLIEKALLEVKIFFGGKEERYLEYQRPTLEALSFAFYAEYGEGLFNKKKRVFKNPPLTQIKEFAEFPAYFLINPNNLGPLLEACRIKNYISLESRGGLCQYALIYHDLSELVEFMIQGGKQNVNSRYSSIT